MSLGIFTFQWTMSWEEDNIHLCIQEALGGLHLVRAQVKSVCLPIVEKTGYYFENEGLNTWIGKSLKWLGE